MGGRTALLMACLLTVCVGLAGCRGEGGDDSGARVTRVIDGDTVVMERLGRVRLIGANAPEEGRCYESAATRFTRERLEGEVVQYELGEEREDRYGRTLAYLSREGRMHNLELVREGYARALIIPPNDKYERRFEQAEREAQARDEGLWYTCDRERIRASRAAARRRERAREASRAAARERRRARRALAQARRQARRERAAARERQAEEEALAPPEESGGDNAGGSCLPSSACPGKRDGDGDGCYCE